jgi:hypothetical protein
MFGDLNGVSFIAVYLYSMFEDGREKKAQGKGEHQML